MSPDTNEPSVDGGSAVRVEKRPNESLSHAILRGISDIKGVDMQDLDTLYYNIDISSTEKLMAHAERHGCSVSVELTFEGITVTIEGEDEILLSDPAPETSD